MQKGFQCTKNINRRQGKKNPQERRKTELNFPFNPFSFPSGTLSKHSLLEAERVWYAYRSWHGWLGLLGQGEYRASPPACRDDGVNHLHEQEAEFPHTHTTSAPSLTSDTLTHLDAQAAGDAQQLPVCRCERARLHTRVSESSKSTNSKFRLCKISAASEHGDVLPGISVYLVSLSKSDNAKLPFLIKDYAGNICI